MSLFISIYFIFRLILSCILPIVLFQIHPVEKEKNRAEEWPVDSSKV